MWIKVCGQDELPEGKALSLNHEELEIGVFHTEDGIYAIDNICPHVSAELHYGVVKDGRVACPFHGWKFKLDDGACEMHHKFNTTVFPVKTEAQAIWVDVAGGVIKSD